MRTFSNIDVRLEDPVSVALGTFDGLHAGHRAVIRAAVDSARSAGLTPAVFTFSTLPKNAFLPPEKQVKPLLTFEEKAGLIEKMGVELLFAPAFASDIYTIPAEDFIKDILIGRLRAKHIVCGYDHRFGAGGAGDTDLLMRVCREENVGVTIVPPVMYKGEKISSTMIRQMLLDGRKEEAEALLNSEFGMRNWSA